jgi:hypothetical protein
VILRKTNPELPKTTNIFSLFVQFFHSISVKTEEIGDIFDDSVTYLFFVFFYLKNVAQRFFILLILVVSCVKMV